MSACSCPNCHAGIRIPGCWYVKTAWRRTSAAVIARDGRICQVVKGCTYPGRVADHILPVHRDMAWHQFISMSNLRASCTHHNTARGVAARLDRELADGMTPAGVRHPLVQGHSFFRVRERNNRALPKSLSFSGTGSVNSRNHGAG